MPDDGRLHSKPEQNTLAAMLSAQNALPDYDLNDGPETPTITTAAQARGFTSGIRRQAFGKVPGIRDNPIKR